MHKSDQYIGLMKPWVKVSSKPIEKDKEYFCVATWGSMHILKCPKFMWLTSKIGSELHSKVHGEHLVGETRQVCNWGISDFRAETFTVWHEREAMATFYKSGAHKNAMESMKHDIDFRARRVWVTGTEIYQMREILQARRLLCCVLREVTFLRPELPIEESRESTYKFASLRFEQERSEENL